LCNSNTLAAATWPGFAAISCVACCTLLQSIQTHRYAFNIIFNILNKSALNAFPCPWLISTLQLGAFWEAAF